MKKTLTSQHENEFESFINNGNYIQFMKNFLVLFLIVFGFWGCTENHKTIKTELVPLSTKENFLNSFISAIGDPILDQCKLITFSKYSYHFLDDYQAQISQLYPSFSYEDNDYLIAQINRYEEDENNHNEDTLQLKNLELITEIQLKALGTTHTAFWDNFHQQFGKVPFIKCSKPLFTKNSVFAIMEINIQANPVTKFKNGVYVYKQINSTWTYFKRLE